MSAPQTFPPDPLSVRAARRFVSEALQTYPDMARQFADLLVSELATNSILHARSDFIVTVEHEESRVRVAVTDGGGGSPIMGSPTPDAPSGRGLKIVNEFAETWGVDELEHGGKTVWFTLATGHSRVLSSERQTAGSAVDRADTESDPSCGAVRGAGRDRGGLRTTGRRDRSSSSPRLLRTRAR